MMALMRRNLLDVLLVLAALVAFAGVISTRDRPTSGELEARRDNLLASFRPEQLERISVERARARTVLERAPGDELSPTPDALDQYAVAEWRITEPVQQPASYSRVRDFISALEVATVVRRLEAPAGDRAGFGLQAPRAVVRLEMGPVTYRIAIGGPAPTPSGAVYVEVTGEGVERPGIAIVEGALASKLDVGAEAFRQRRLSPYHPEELERLALEREGVGVTLRRELRRWRFEGMFHDRLVDRRVLDALLTQIGELEAEQVVPAPELTGDGRALRVVLSPLDRSRPRVVLRIGGPCPGGAGVVAARLEPEPISGCVGDETQRALFVAPETLLSRRPFSLAADEVEELVSSGAGKRLELVRTRGGFTLRAPRSGEVELEAGNARLADITDARGALVETSDLRALGLAEPSASVTVRSSAASEAEVTSETVDVGVPDANGRVHLLRRVDGAVLRVDADTARAFMPDATLLERAELLELEPKQVQRVEVEGTVRQTLEQADGGRFRLLEPVGYAVDAALATDLVNTLATLSAERWVADEDDGSFGIGAPTLRLKLTSTGAGDAGRDYQLLVGRPTAGGLFAQISGRPGVFVIARRTADALDRWLIDRSGLSVDTSGARRIELEAATSKLVLERVGQGFEQLEGPRLSSMAVQQLVDALDSLRAEGIVHPGLARADEGFERPTLVIRIELEPGRVGPREIRVGAGGVWRGSLVDYARPDVVNGTFAIARERVRVVLDLMR